MTFDQSDLAIQTEIGKAQQAINGSVIDVSNAPSNVNSTAASRRPSMVSRMTSVPAVTPAPSNFGSGADAVKPAKMKGSLTGANIQMITELGRCGYEL